MKKLVQKMIAWKAKKILQRHKPTVVAVTGSVGKTSTRNAVATVLEADYHVRTNPKNYNNEFGIPLTIIGKESPGRSIWGWIKLFVYADKQILFGNPDYPNMLVLEYATDGPGDIGYLCDIARPDVGIVTAISPVHAENFGTMDKLIKEKMTLAKRVPPDGLVVLNADDSKVVQMQDHISAPVSLYGEHQKAHVRAENVRTETREDFSFDPGERFSAIHFDLLLRGERYPVVLYDLLGAGQVLAALAAVSVGDYFEMEEKTIVERLAEVVPQAGRMRPVPGIKGALILDDSYNAAPASVAAALDVLALFDVRENACRIAVLGTMAELGQYSEDAHQKVGRKAVENGVDILIAAGEPARDILRGARDAGMPEEHMHYFETSEDAGRWLDRNIDPGDIVLVKGSQSVRMEKAVKDIMAEPLRAEELLVRQYGKWLD